MAAKRDFWDIVMQVPEIISDSDQKQLQATYTSLGREVVFNEAREKKRLPYVAHVLTELCVDEEFWSSIHDEWLKRNKKVLEILQHVFQEFHKSGCSSPVVTENFGALLISNSCMGCFCSGDVDLSADPAEKEKIRDTLERLGLSRKVRKAYHAEIQEDEYLCPDVWLKDFYINIVWLPVVREKEYTVDQRKIIPWLKKERINGVCYADTSIRILSPEAMLLHCVYHLSVGHYYVASPGIRLLTELDRIARFCKLNWVNVMGEAKQLGIEKRLLTALCLTKLALDTPVPQDVLMTAAKTRAVQVLVQKLYPVENQTYVVHEPMGLKERLYIDILSDPGLPMIAAIRKVIYAVRYQLIKQ